jgi:hypothetical protein
MYSSPCTDLVLVLRVTGYGGSQIRRYSAHEGAKVFGLTHRAASILQDILLIFISVIRRFDPRVTKSIKDSIDTIRNPTRDLPICSAVPQPEIEF